MASRIVSADDLARYWLETRTVAEISRYQELYKLTVAICKDVYSKELITPGITTTDELVYWVLEKASKLGISCWFTPTFDIQRTDQPGRITDNQVVLPGDLLHCDMGFKYLGLASDLQRMAYLPLTGETTVPAGLLAALAQGNRFQEICCSCFIEGYSGNEIFALAIEKAKNEGLKPRLYTHPIGFHGHGAGPLIGLWDQQGFIFLFL